MGVVFAAGGEVPEGGVEENSGCCDWRGRVSGLVGGGVSMWFGVGGGGACGVVCGVGCGLGFVRGWLTPEAGLVEVDGV